MKLLADESVDFPIVSAFRKSGIDITYIAEISPGIEDTGVLSMANQDGRILLTADKDFGELVFRLKLIHFGVILYRLSGFSNLQKVNLMNEAFAKYAPEFGHHFVVITKTQIRIKKTDNTK